MFKKIINIITYPFYLLYILITFPFKIIIIIITDKNKKNDHDKTNLIDELEFNKIAELLFPFHRNEFKKYYTSFIYDKNNFLIENKRLLDNYHNCDVENLEMLEVLYIFGDSKKQLVTIDWRGEENEGEIEENLKTYFQVNNNFINVNKIRESRNEKIKDENFIIELLKAFSEDIKLQKKEIIFLNLNWDAYVFSIIDQSSYQKIIKNGGTLFNGIENITKF